MNCLQIHECRNWEGGLAVSFLVLHKLYFRYSVGLLKRCLRPLRPLQRKRQEPVALSQVVHYTVYRHSEQCRHMLPSILNGGGSSLARNLPSALRQMRVNLPGLLGIKIAHLTLLSCAPNSFTHETTVPFRANMGTHNYLPLCDATFHKKITRGVHNPWQAHVLLMWN